MNQENHEVEVMQVNSAEVAKIESMAVSVIEEARSITITDQATYDEAGTFLQGVHQLIKAYESEFEGPIKSANKTHKMLTQWRGKHVKPLEEAKKLVKVKSINWLNEQERIRQAEERRLQKLKDDEERKRREEFEAKAQEAEVEGKTEKADLMRSQAEKQTFEMPIVEPKAHVAPGQSVNFKWKARVTDESRVPRMYMMPDEKKLNQLADATNGEAMLPGVEFYKDYNMAIR